MTISFSLLIHEMETVKPTASRADVHSHSQNAGVKCLTIHSVLRKEGHCWGSEKKSSGTQSGCPESQCAGNALWPAESAFVRPFCPADSFGSVFLQGPAFHTWEGARGRLQLRGPAGAGWGGGAEAAGEAHVR